MKMVWNLNRVGGFSIRAAGFLAHNPEVLVAPQGRYCRFCLTGGDNTEEYGPGRFTISVQSVWFVATHLVGAAIADCAREGDHLLVDGRMEPHHWTAGGKNDVTTLVVTGFRFATRKRGSELECMRVLGCSPVSSLETESTASSIPGCPGSKPGSAVYSTKQTGRH